MNQIKGSIGYVELAYATENKMTYAAVKNKAGVVVQPTAASFQAAAAGADWTHEPDFYEASRCAGQGFLANSRDHVRHHVQAAQGPGAPRRALTLLSRGIAPYR